MTSIPPIATTIVERYERRETSVEEAMIEMHLAGVSARRIEDVSEILWGASVSAATVSSLNEKAFEAVERLNREIRRRTRLAGTFPDGRSALMPVTVRLKHVADSEWGSRRYLDVSLLDE